MIIPQIFHQGTQLLSPSQIALVLSPSLHIFAIHAVPKAMALVDVETATAEAPTLQAVPKALQTGQWAVKSGTCQSFPDTGRSNMSRQIQGQFS